MKKLLTVFGTLLIFASSHAEVLEIVGVKTETVYENQTYEHINIQQSKYITIRNCTIKGATQNMQRLRGLRSDHLRGRNTTANLQRRDELQRRQLRGFRGLCVRLLGLRCSHHVDSGPGTTGSGARTDRGRRPPGPAAAGRLRLSQSLAPLSRGPWSPYYGPRRLRGVLQDPPGVHSSPALGLTRPLRPGGSTYSRGKYFSQSSWVR